MAKVLVIDDSPTVIEALQDCLEGKGHEVVPASSGPDGIEKAKSEEDLDLVILDYHMPEMNGLEVAKILKGDEQTNKVPIVMLTTQSDRALKEEGQKLGVIGWILKPFTPEGIIFCVEHLQS